MIDGTNYKTAYVSGMKEDVRPVPSITSSEAALMPVLPSQMKMNNNELNFMDIYYRIGYAIFLLPCQIILTKVKPNWWLPSNEMAWGLMTGKCRCEAVVRCTDCIPVL
jgi:ACS family pantothenate transporter-like MFS transporter